MPSRLFVDLARERCRAYLPRLHFLAEMPQARLFPIIAAARMVVMPSRSESLANACLEAMALGLPVVATTGTGLAELIANSVDGFLIPPGDAVALTYQGPHHGVGRRPARAHPRGRSPAGVGLDLDRMVDRLVQVYEDLVDGGAPAHAATAT